MTMQAYVDDSRTNGKVLVFAGYIASVPEWLAFSKDWQERLDMWPRWPAFKMSEIAASADAQRHERAGGFYRVIEDHARAFVAIAVDEQALIQVVQELGFPDYLENPYITAFRAIFDFTAQLQHELGITEPIDFIFDERSEKEQVRRGFEVFKQTCDPAIRGRVGNEPRFERDEDYLPLQAADLLAWHVRRHWLEHGSITTTPVRVSWPEKRAIRGYNFDMDYHNLATNMVRLKALVMKNVHGVDMPSSGIVTVTVKFTGLDGKKI